MRFRFFNSLLLGVLFSLPDIIEARPPQNFKVLLYTSPDRYHNQALPTAIKAFEHLAEKNFFTLTWTQLQSDIAQANLKQYAVVVFLFSNARELNTEQVSALQSFVRAGGGFVGVHSSSVDSAQDPWFKKLVGRSFRGHPEKQSGVLDVADKNFPATMHLPDRWLWTDEWYEFGEALTPNLHVILKVDESTYSPLEHQEPGGRPRIGMDGDHPIAWYQEFEGGRSFYTALGHSGIYYEDAWFLMHLYGGIYWAATGNGVAQVK
jgi:type 1 glutamine amidotransferase